MTMNETNNYKQFKAAALAFIVGTSSALAGVVTGKIIDSETREPLIGVSVVAKGTTAGTITDLDGNYELKIPDGTYDLVFRYVGYDDYTIPKYIIKGNMEGVDVEMGVSANRLSEVTVTTRASNL